LSDERLEIRSQLQDYALRGEDLEYMNIIDFVKDTYESYIKKTDRDLLIETEDNIPSKEIDDLDLESLTNVFGRPPSKRSYYLTDHPSRNRYCRVRRPFGHKTLIDVVGKFFPKFNPADESSHNYYYGSMLTLLHPWRSLGKLKEENETWKEAFDRFTSSCSDDARRYLSNIQFYYESKDAAKRTDLGYVPGDNNRQILENNQAANKGNSFGLDVSDEEYEGDRFSGKCWLSELQVVNYKS
jgi:hypothetical protein